MFLRTKTWHTLEYSVPEGKGYVLSRMVPECNQAGEVVSVLVLSTDISERKRRKPLCGNQKHASG
jgi:PAS domain-containing protein